MSYQQLIILLPCHSLEDFPVHHEGDDAAGLLAGWSALWHPQLIASAHTIPPPVFIALSDNTDSGVSIQEIRRL